MNKEPMKPLPDKLSDLLVLAVADARKIKRNKNYKLDSHSWVVVDPDGCCRVCLAGAVMVKTMGVKVKRELGFYVAPENTDQDSKLRALDYMRIGSFMEAASRMLKCRITDKRWDALNAAGETVISSAMKNGFAPFSAYLKAAKILKKAGL